MMFQQLKYLVIICAIVKLLHVTPSYSCEDSTSTKQKYSSKQITELITQLGSNKFKEREIAKKKLLQIGKAAIPELKNFVIHKNATLQSSIREILMQLAINGNEVVKKSVFRILRPVVTPKWLAENEIKQKKLIVQRWIDEKKVCIDNTYSPILIVTFDKKFSVTNEVLCHFKHIKQLNQLYLELDNTKITDAGLVHLKELKTLTSLSLDNTKITDAGFIHLSELKSLQILTLNNTIITGAGLVHLKELESLEFLNLNNTKITDAGLAHLKELKNLEWIYLINTKITDAGLVHLKGIKTLKFLYLNDTKITDAGLVHLKELKSLLVLKVNNTKITKKGLTALKEALPRLLFTKNK